ncbi:MAG: RecB family exonuclease [Mycobacteriales bacterium]|nr:MAG: recombinase RecB [Pseudonocardiales bacterium]
MSAPAAEPSTDTTDWTASGLERGRGGDGGSARVPGQVHSLSPSRASDFKTCPLLYRLRSIDRLPERPSPDAVRGTVVHAVLERLYDLPAAERTLGAAVSLVGPQWQRLLELEPTLAELFGADPADPADPDHPDRADESAWLDSARALVEGYFTLEDPQRLEPAERECLVETELDDGLRLRGYVDRLDVTPTGDIRVVDYKTGGAPREAFEAKALFQMKFYALVLWRSRGVIPRMLRLIYLKDRDTLTYTPDEDELRRFERTLQAIWVAITRAMLTEDFRPSPGALCAWCDHQALCPAFGGTPPPYPHPEQDAEAPATAPPTTPV